ncbi:MAG: TPM domain-containing protein [Candidatus Sungiibacteriota bacterium]|uniref:TPM domain-containing protein n=1 Tax=Candidatus Sungiibacteriota bacterium TaxID=2750080 RepID=A0A7T5UQC8_9BACT|nr:MAG: TPM domain-containing protein [Candidatus Sungbacteria bacterium]
MKRSLVLIVGLFSLFLAVPVLHASEFCDTRVYDSAGVLDNNDRARLEEAAARLVSAGAEVRVRVSKTLNGSANIDAYEKQVERQCASWQATDGNRKNNLVVLMVATQARKSGIFYGSEWKPALDGAWNKVRTQHMNPSFRDGRWADGVVKGLNAVGELLEQQMRAPVVAPAPPPSPQVVVVQPNQPSAPTDYSGLWTVMKLMLGLIVLVGLAMLLGAFLKRREGQRAARQKAMLAKQDAASRINTLDDELVTLEAVVGAMVNKVSEEDAEPLRDGMVRAQKLFASAAENFHGLGQAANDPERPGLTVAEYEAIAQSYGVVVAKLYEARGIKDEINKRVFQLSSLIADSAKVVAAVNTAITTATQNIAEVRKQGFLTSTADTLLLQAQTKLKEADSAIQQKRYGEAHKTALSAGELVQKAVTSAEELPKIKQELTTGIVAASGRIETVNTGIAAAKEVFDRISEKYAKTSWESVRGNGTEARKRVESAERTTMTLQAMVSMDKQEWDKARAGLKEATTWLDEAESLLRSIHEREKGLALAERDASKEVIAAEVDIRKARDYVHQYDDEIKDTVEAELRKAERVVVKAKQELVQEKPDFPLVVKLAKEANDTADEILLEAISEHEAAERLRAKAKNIMRDAERAVSKAQEYIEDHKHDVGSSAKGYLSDAQKYLGRAQAALVFEDKISLAEKGQKKGNEAYSKAKDDVEDAHESSRRSWGSSSVVVIGGGGGYSSGDYSHSSGDYSSGGYSSGGDSGSSDSGGGGGWGSDSGGGGGGDFGGGGGGGGGGDF